MFCVLHGHISETWSYKGKRENNSQEVILSKKWNNKGDGEGYFVKWERRRKGTWFAALRAGYMFPRMYLGKVVTPSGSSHPNL